MYLKITQIEKIGPGRFIPELIFLSCYTDICLHKIFICLLLEFILFKWVCLFWIGFN